MKEGLAPRGQARGRRARRPRRSSAIDRAGIPVMAHLGFTPQSEHALGGYRVQGRGDAAERLVEDALALQEAGAFAVVLEMVPAPGRRADHREPRDPDHRHRRRPDCDAQVLVWQDMAGLRPARSPRFVKRYADLRRGAAGRRATAYARTSGGRFPGAEHSFEA